MRQLLLVEERLAFRECLALLIAPRLDCTNIQAGTFDEARRILSDSEGGIGLSIVGLDLPGGDAVELIEDLRDSVKDVSVLAYTDGRNPRARTRALLAGADEVLTLRVSAWCFLDAAARLGKVAQREERQQA